MQFHDLSFLFNNVISKNEIHINLTLQLENNEKFVASSKIRIFVFFSGFCSILRYSVLL